MRFAGLVRLSRVGDRFGDADWLVHQHSVGNQDPAVIGVDENVGNSEFGHDAGDVSGLSRSVPRSRVGPLAAGPAPRGRAASPVLSWPVKARISRAHVADLAPVEPVELRLAAPDDHLRESDCDG